MKTLSGLIIILLMATEANAQSLCDDSMATVDQTLSLDSRANSDSGEVNCPLRNLALWKIKNSSNTQEITRSLEIIREQVIFTATAADITLAASKSLKDEETRVLAAKVFYLLFYHLEEIEIQQAAIPYLLNPTFVKDFVYFIHNDQATDVVVFFLQTTQVMLNPFRKIEAPVLKETLNQWQKENSEKLGETYIPVVLEFLLAYAKDKSDRGLQLKQEACVALVNLSAASALKAQSNIDLFKKWVASEAEPYLLENFSGHPVLAPHLKSSSL